MLSFLEFRGDSQLPIHDGDAPNNNEGQVLARGASYDDSDAILR